MEIASFGANGSALIARDQFEMALGGIRLSQIEVPTARNVGQSASGGACPRGATTCRSMSRPWSRYTGGTASTWKR